MRDSDSFFDGLSRFIELYEEQQLDRRVSEETAKFEALCKDSDDKIFMLHFMRGLRLIFCACGIGLSTPATIVVEKSSRDRSVVTSTLKHGSRIYITVLKMIKLTLNFAQD